MNTLEAVNALRKNEPLTTLELTGSIDANDLRAIAEALHENTTLTTLNLEHLEGYHTDFDDGVGTLADALRTNRTLRVLNLGRCNISDKSAQAIADALRINTTLRVLRLRHSFQSYSDIIRSRGAIADTLRVNRTLSTVYLGGNDIGIGGARVLIDALHENTTLTTLDLHPFIDSDEEYFYYERNDGFDRDAPVLKTIPEINEALCLNWNNIVYLSANMHGAALNYNEITREELIHYADERNNLLDQLFDILRSNYLLIRFFTDRIMPEFRNLPSRLAMEIQDMIYGGPQDATTNRDLVLWLVMQRYYNHHPIANIGLAREVARLQDEITRLQNEIIRTLQNEHLPLPRPHHLPLVEPLDGGAVAAGLAEAMVRGAVPTRALPGSLPDLRNMFGGSLS